MLKKILFAFFVLFVVRISYSQTSTTVFLQLKGEVNMFDEIRLVAPSPPNKIISKADSLINYNTIREIFSKTNESEQVVNLLAEHGWELFSVTWISRNETNIHRYPFLLYYFKKNVTGITK